MIYPAYTLPVWLTDEQVLRDEAVLFGLSEARPDEKIAAIRLAFAALTAPLEKQIEQQHEAIGNLNLLLDADDNQTTLVPTSSQKSQFGGWPLGTCLVGLLVSLALCVGTYAGTFALANAQLALVVAGLTGLSGCVTALLVSQSVYRNRLENKGLAESRADGNRKQQLADRTKWEQQKRVEIGLLYQAEAALNQQNAHRDVLIHLFESEFDLARSLRHQVRDRFVDM